MTPLYDLLKWLFGRKKPDEADQECPNCYGLGYDSSGFTCSCLREKK